jgi:RHS repeat-associated protein
MNQKRTDFRTKLDEFYTELAQTSIYYGILNDTAYQDSLYWQEQHLYGSSRLGMAKPELEITNYTPSNQISYTSNFRNYELTNHLGNVLSTIKDEKQQIDANNDGIVDYYEPIVITSNDYYPFGMVMPNRSFSLGGSNYRFGFNGQEKDDEVYGKGNLMTAQFWEYDTRLGRRWNLDPKPNPSISNYACFANNPILNTDVKGDTLNVTTDKGVYLFRLDDGKTEISKMTAKQLYAKQVQWFEPTADNYMPLISTAKDISTTKAMKHFTWNQIAEFAETDRWMISYRQGGSGDWKAEGKPGDGFLLVEVEGVPYWGDAIGQIPFAVDKFTDELLNTGSETKAAQNTLQAGKEYGDGKLVGGETDNSNKYDNAMLKRGVNWAKERYDAKRVPNGKDPRNGTHIELNKTKHSPSNLSKPSNVKQ